VHVQLGTRLQASLVLSCPGVDLAPLAAGSPYSSRSRSPDFDAELASVEERLGPSVERRMKDAARRRGRIVRSLTREGRWVEEEEVRDLLRRRIPRPGPEDFPVGDPPSTEDGLELLPLYYDGRAGPVALAGGLGGWEALELRPSGGIERHLGSIPPPTVPPALTSEAEALLVGYLRYFLERDLLFAFALARMVKEGEGSVTQWMEEELREIGATVLSRASVRAKLAGGGAVPLSAADLVRGIRATDQDLMDVSTWGDRL
jgi:hypothetical protein